MGSGVVGVVTGLGRDLRGLRDIPLSITSVQGSGPAFRHTQVSNYIDVVKKFHTLAGKRWPFLSLTNNSIGYRFINPPPYVVMEHFWICML